MTAFEAEEEEESEKFPTPKKKKLPAIMVLIDRVESTETEKQITQTEKLTLLVAISIVVIQKHLRATNLGSKGTVDGAESTTRRREAREGEAEEGMTMKTIKATTMLRVDGRMGE